MAKTDFLSLYTELSHLNKQIADLTKQKELITGRLTAAIPPNGEKSGIRHIVTTGSSVSYAKALLEIKDTLIPKTKHEAIPEILSRFTTVYEKHSFKVVR